MCAIYSQRNMKIYTKKIFKNFLITKYELQVIPTEKQKRNNINYGNHHNHQDSCVRFTYFHCICVGCAKSKLNRSGPCCIGAHDLRQTFQPTQI